MVLGINTMCWWIQQVMIRFAFLHGKIVLKTASFLVIVGKSDWL